MECDCARKMAALAPGKMAALTQKTFKTATPRPENAQSLNATSPRPEAKKAALCIPAP